MFDRIIVFSIRNKVAIGIMTLVLVLVGIYSAYNLPVDAQPDITNNQVQINFTSRKPWGARGRAVHYRSHRIIDG